MSATDLAGKYPETGRGMRFFSLFPSGSCIDCEVFCYQFSPFV